jgi:ATP-binding cassette subfamily F protein 3
VMPFDGDLDDYQKWLLEVSRANSRGLPAPPVPGAAPVAAPAAVPKPAPTPTVKAAAAPVATPKAVARDTAAAAGAPGAYRRDDRKQSAQARAELANRTRPMRNELLQIDAKLAKLGTERSALEAELAGGRLAGAQIADKGRLLNHATAELARLEERWLELQAEVDALNQAAD